MSKQRIFLIVLLLLAVVGYFGYNYVYQDHRNIKTETSQLEITAPYLLERFKTNDAEELLNKTITVTGEISNIEGDAITLEESVYASFDTMNTEVSVKDKVKIKGRCIGYDELFEIVKLDQSTVIK
ncbi:hypothetical protein K8089_09695 [Aequorivita sp. F47161]|jgi:hypothetical protein|uniref:tRNA_anti-like n=1 Tax=Aequorivita vitellina TaxID=2874475 RepID=A0A9X1QVX3_9FLAO|nr:hypothetical protein [Aequorivita vitellina]MCG2419295.1 hypothetical protein [Aequorivita vitellina]MCZ4318898.1 hypothetical protein [Aequorivita viscosa]